MRPDLALGPDPDICHFEDDGSYWVTCWSCGGEGLYDDQCTCMDDCCCCLYPDPPTCSECGGAGTVVACFTTAAELCAWLEPYLALLDPAPALEEPTRMPNVVLSAAAPAPRQGLGARIFSVVTG